jgi:hypothetical protein
MPQRALPGGIRAVGSAMARFFLPSQKNWDQWPQNNKRHLDGVLVVGKGIRWIRHKDQMCYLVRIGNIDNSTIFYISKRNFKVTLSGAVPFNSEMRAPVEPAIDAPVINELRASGRNVVPNIGNLSRGGTREEIEELRWNGITVDNDNDLAPKNAEPEVAIKGPPVGATWEKLTYCNRHANSNFLDTARKFKHHWWDQIAEYNELKLFWMCFPEDYIRNVVIPTTNKTLTTKMTLQEFTFGSAACSLWHATRASPIKICGGQRKQSTCSRGLCSTSTPT